MTKKIKSALILKRKIKMKIRIKVRKKMRITTLQMTRKTRRKKSTRMTTQKMNMRTISTIMVRKMKISRKVRKKRKRTLQTRIPLFQEKDLKKGLFSINSGKMGSEKKTGEIWVKQPQ